MIVGKLVRYHTPNIIEERGERPIFRKVKGDELLFRLKETIDSLTTEVLNEPNIQAMTDLITVLGDYGRYIDLEGLDSMKNTALKRFADRGTFLNAAGNEGHFLVSVKEALTEEEKKAQVEERKLEELLRTAQHASTNITIMNLPNGSQIHLDPKHNEFDKLEGITTELYIIDGEDNE